jgi:hypothetical protein
MFLEEIHASHLESTRRKVLPEITFGGQILVFTLRTWWKVARTVTMSSKIHQRDREKTMATKQMRLGANSC